jgi:flagellar hook-associated protein 2
MNRVSLGGLISGMDVDAVIEKLMALESTRLKNVQRKQADLQAKQKVWQDVRSKLDTLKLKLDGLRFSSSFRARKATYSDDTVASVTAAAGSTLTTHSLTVDRLATTHVVASKLYNGPNDAVGAAAAGKFTINGKEIVIDQNDTLNSIRDKINGVADIGVRADVVQVVNGATVQYRLALTAKQSGTAGTITIAETGGTPAQELGLLVWDNTSSQWVTNDTSKAQDAHFFLNGQEYTTSSNTISNAIPGLTITLKKAGTTQVTIEQDVDAVADKVKAWVDALNDAISFLKEKTSYDSEKKTGGPLAGDSLARNILTSLRNTISRAVSGLPSSLNEMSEVGVKTGAWGTADYGKVVFDREKFKTQLLSDENGVAKLFGALRNNIALGATVTASSTAAGSFSSADVVNGTADSDRFGSVGGGWESAGVPSPGSPETLTIDLPLNNGVLRTIDQVILSMPDNATYVASQSGLKDYKLEYKGADGNWYTIADVTNNVGATRVFDFAPVQASQVRLTITGTYGSNNPARVTELQVNEYNDGTVASMYRFVDSLLKSTTGALDARDSSMKDQLQSIQKQIDRLTDQLDRYEQNLRAQFARMEKIMSRLQSQGGSLMAALLGGNAAQS